MRRERMTDGERLRLQAAQLDARADALNQEARDLRREAVELRIDADRLQRAPLRVVAARRPRSYGEAVREAARQLDAFQVSALDAALPDVATSTVYAWIKRLTDAGVLAREGRGYLYSAPDAIRERSGEATLRVTTIQTPARELQDREVAWTTQAP